MGRFNYYVQMVEGLDFMFEGSVFLPFEHRNFT